MPQSFTRAMSTLCLLGALGWAAQAQDPPAPKIVLSPESWDFGEAWHGEEPTTTLTIKNEGNADLKLTRVKAC